MNATAPRSFLGLLFYRCGRIIELRDMKIQNTKTVARDDARKTVLAIAETALAAIDTRAAIRQFVSYDGVRLGVGGDFFSLESVDKLYVIAIGKCSVDAASALEEILGDRIYDGIAMDMNEGVLSRIRVVRGQHPMPTQENVDATKAIIELLRPLKENDFVLFVISGGGSTFLCQPEELTCVDEANILSCMFESGAGIRDINVVRKHISLARGGYLAKYAYPARAVSLIFADVPGDDIEFVASGPTVKDTTTVADAKIIAEKFNISARCNIADIGLLETPKEDKYFEKMTNILLISNSVALDAMKKEAEKKGFFVDVRSKTLQGEARDVASDIVEALHKAKPGTVHLYGGETTVTVRKPGKGGRNLEMALSALRYIAPGEIVLPLATDGRDNTDFAGAICDMMTKEDAQKLELDIDAFLENNNSYDFFDRTGDYIMTGLTGSNVSDLIIAFKAI